MFSTNYGGNTNPEYMTDVYSDGTVDSGCRRAAIEACIQSRQPTLQPLVDGAAGPLAPIADVFTPIFDPSYGRLL